MRKTRGDRNPPFVPESIDVSKGNYMGRGPKDINAH